MRLIKFVKMQGIGNDFVVVSSFDIGRADASKLAVALCDRHTGIGADGLLVIGPSLNAIAFSFRMYNPDGTPDMCGNGFRCVILYAHHAGLVPNIKDPVFVETIDGTLKGYVLDVSPDGNLANIRVQMAVPKLDVESIPFVGPVEDSQIVDYPIDIDGYSLSITAVNTGSTHSVIFVDELPDDNLFFSISPKLEVHPYFPERTSLMWAKITGDSQFQIRIWERAAGETLGCGTGASAVAVAAIVRGLASHTDPVQVISKGGTLEIGWAEAPNSPLWLTGPATWVYSGEFTGETPSIPQS